jgi:hypothetical protein
MPTTKTKTKTKTTTTTLRPRSQRVRTRPTDGEVILGGRLNADSTYLTFKTTDGKVIDLLEGQRLYRLAQAIVTRFETAQTA